MESKIENPTHNFKEMNLVLQLINKKSTFLYRLFYPKEFFYHLRFISMYNVLNTLAEYTYFFISKNITSYTFSLFFKMVEYLRNVSLNRYFEIDILRYMLWWQNLCPWRHQQTFITWFKLYCRYGHLTKVW